MSTYLKYPVNDAAAEQNLVILYQKPSGSRFLGDAGGGVSFPVQSKTTAKLICSVTDVIGY